MGGSSTWCSLEKQANRFRTSGRSKEKMVLPVSRIIVLIRVPFCFLKKPVGLGFYRWAVKSRFGLFMRNIYRIKEL